MGVNLGKLVKTALSTAKRSVDDAVKTVTYVNKASEPVYDPVAGTFTGGETSYQLDVVLLRYSDSDVDGDVVRDTDQRMLVAAQDVTFEPGNADYVILLDGRWNVVTRRKDPTGTALLTFQLRKP